jgi:hypothetical protein
MPAAGNHGQVICSAVNMQLRDLRLLDPQLSTSYPSAILARDDALVLNLEFIKVGSDSGSRDVSVLGPYDQGGLQVRQ